MTIEHVSRLGWIVGFALAFWKMRGWSRAFFTSRRMRLHYEEQTPEKQKEIEKSWKEGSLNGAYTKPVPIHLAILYVAIAVVFLASLIYFTYIFPQRHIGR